MKIPACFKYHPQQVGKPTGFTIIELLVSIAIIGTLIALLLPAVQNARRSARKLQCQSRLKQLSLALHNYHETHSVFPPGAIVYGPAFGTTTGWGWGAMVLPQMEQSPIYDRIDFSVHNAVGTNRLLINTRLLPYVCPSDSQPDSIDIIIAGEGPVSIATGNYVGSAFILGPLSHVRERDITDGLSQSLLLGERKYVPPNSLASASTSGWVGLVSGVSSYSFLNVVYVSPNSRSVFTGEHNQGENFAFADGSVHFFSRNIDEDTFKALGSIAGDEAISFEF